MGRHTIRSWRFRLRTEPRLKAAGFTMVELVVGMSIVAILTAIAVPSFASLTASQRAKTAGAEIYSALLTTRSIAIQRNANVTLAPISGNWANGWQILDPANPASALDNRGATTGVTITGPGSIIYRPSGRVLSGSATDFLVTSTVRSTQFNQCVSVDLGGRPYIVSAATC